MLRIISLVAEYVVLVVARSYINISYMLINQQVAVIVMVKKKEATEPSTCILQLRREAENSL